MGATPHTHFRQGQKVFVILRDGTRFDARFFQREGKFVNFYGIGRIAVAKVRAIIINRNNVKGKGHARSN